MGYSIPGADFTESDKLQVNVGASVGASAANAISSFTRAWQANAAKTEKLLGVKSEFRNQIVIANNAVSQATIKKGIASGNFKKGTSIFEQWSQEVIKRGKEATDASMQMRFGNLDEDQEAEQLKIVNRFNNYNESSLQNMGRYTADVLATNDPTNKQYSTGDIATGEHLNNLVTMTAANGADPQTQFGEGAKSTRKLIVDGDENIISSSVSIPKKNDFIKNMETGSSAFNDIIAKGLENGNIVDDGENYIFNRELNMGVYGTEAGPDFLVDYTEKINQSKVYQNANFTDDKNQLKDTSYVGNNKEGFQKFVTTKNTPNNNFQTTTFEAVDMFALVSNDTFQTDISTEAKTLLRPGRSARAIAADMAETYKTADIESFKKDFPGLDKYNTFEEFYASKDAKLKTSFTEGIIQESLFQNVFKDQKVSGDKDGVNFVSRQLDEKKDAELIKYLQDNNVKNRSGEDYKAGDFVYGREIIKSEKIIKPKPISNFEKIYRNLQKSNSKSSNAVTFAALTETPAGSKIMYMPNADNPGTYVISDGVAVGTKPLEDSEGALNNLFKLEY